MSYARVHYVVTAADAAAANAALEAAGYGPGSISAPLCAVGSPAGTPASHFWCGWSLEEAEEAVVMGILASLRLVEGPRLARLFIPSGTADEAALAARVALLAGLGLEPARKD